MLKFATNKKVFVSIKYGIFDLFQIYLDHVKEIKNYKKIKNYLLCNSLYSFGVLPVCFLNTREK